MDSNESEMVWDVKSCWIGRGRGWSEALCFDGCVCHRPHYVVMCHYCGYHCRGRLRIECKIHPNVCFLMDLDHCPKCKANQYLMSEGRIDDYARPSDVFPPVLPEKSQKQCDTFHFNADHCSKRNRRKKNKHGRQ